MLRPALFPKPGIIDTFTYRGSVARSIALSDHRQETWPKKLWTSETGYFDGGSWSSDPTAGAELAPANTCTSVTGEADVTTGWTNTSMGVFASDTLGTEPVGTHSLHITANGADQRCYTTFTTVVGTIYNLYSNVIVTNGDADSRIQLKVGISENDSSLDSNIIDNGAWEVIDTYFKATATTTYLTLEESGAGNDADLYLDTLAVKPITLSSILTLSNFGFTGGRYWLTPGTVAIGEWLGIVILADDESNPTNAVFAVIDRTTGKLHVWKRVEGTDTTLIETAITYTAGAKLCIVFDRAEQKLWAFYNNAIVGTAQSITDVTVIDNTISGVVSTGDATFTEVDFAPLSYGAELITNGNFAAWVGDNPTGWGVVGEAGAIEITENPAGQCNLITSGADIYMKQTVGTVGLLYYATFDIKSTTGILQFGFSGIGSYNNYNTTGIKTGYFPGRANFYIGRGGATNSVFDDVSVRQVQ